MNSSGHGRKWIAGLMLAALTLTAVAPAAQAKHGESRRKHSESRRYKDSDSRHYKYYDSDYDSRPVRYYQPTRVVEIRRSSCDVPAFAGFIGGLALGATIARAPAHYYSPPPEPAYYYYDPYCQERFVSLTAYYGHVRHYHHPRIVQVISVSTGECVHTYRYFHGGWGDIDEDGDSYYDD